MLHKGLKFQKDDDMTIKTKFAAMAALGMLSTINVSAYTEPTWQDDVANNGNMTGTIAEGGKIFGAKTSAVLTTASIWAKDSRFDLNVKQGLFPSGGTYLMCVDGVQVGSYLTVSTAPNSDDVTTITFQVNTEIAEDSNITFMDGKVYNPSQGVTWGSDRDCNDTATGANGGITPLTIIPEQDKCSIVWTDNGNIQGTDHPIPEMTSLDSHLIAQYQEEIMISCKPPVCTLNDARTGFVDSARASGVNYRAHVGLIDYVADRNETVHNDSCYFGGCLTADTTDANATTCRTYISVRNNTEHNISSFDLDLPNSNVIAGATAAGGHYELNITAGSDANMSVDFTIPAGQIATIGDLDGLINNVDIHPDLTSTQEVVARLDNIKATKFTVTYMNPNYKAFAKITAKADTKLYAHVTDENGNSVDVEFTQGIEAGKTAFVFADAAASHGYDLDALVTAAGGLPGNGWTVEFATNAGVDVAAYMDVDGGQRTLTVIYPEYAGLALIDDNPAAAGTGATAAASFGIATSQDLAENN
jgi:hypothetical protein